MSFYKNFIVVILYGFIMVSYCNSQELPPIQNFSPQDYDGETQNWSISQDDSKTMYVANNKGLIRYDGEIWDVFPSPNQSIIRSIKIIGERIYCGLYMEFGYWKKNEFGKLDYYSLSQNLEKPLIDDEQFWNILTIEDWILFQSLNRIYIYNTLDNSFKIIESDSGITKMFKVDNDIYFQKNDFGLYKIKGGKDELITNSERILNSKLVNVFALDKSLLLQTQDNGVLVYDNGILTDWNNNLNIFLKTKSVYNSIKLRDGNYAFGTISSGLLIINSKGETIYSIDQNNGLGNNTILSLYEDNEENLWLGSDNGITCINMKSPLMVYNDDNGQFGTVYSSSIFNGKLFLGTNQGLFFKNITSDYSFKLIEGTQGQVWSLVEHDGKLFCGHDSGTFIIDNEKANNISNIEGTWNIKPIIGKPNLMIQGNYDGLYLLEKRNSQWKFKHKIKGFNISSRFFEFVSDNEILVSHEYRGITKLTLNEDLSIVENIEINKSIKGLKSSIIKYNDDLLYSYEGGIFRYDDLGRFRKDSILSQAFRSENFVSGKLISDPKNNRLWSFSNQEINYIEPSNLNNEPRAKSIPLPYELTKSVTGYENIMPLDNNIYLIGTTSGYLVIDFNKIKQKDYTTKITSITNSKSRNNKLIKNVSLSDRSTFSNEDRNVAFTYSINEYDKYFKAEYQYQLLGIYDEWSTWSSESEQLFENLPYGDYTFNVRGKTNNSITENIDSYSFSVERPWYLSNFMISQYIIAILLFSLMMHYVYRYYYKKQRTQLLEQKNKEIELKELANKQQSMSFKNEKLEQDIENKNRELAISTMSLIKKNEFLNSIKNELININDNKDIRSVVKIIDKNLNNTDDWKLFQEAFNNADKNFLKKVKSIHPSLTPNDLRLCAYLRLNLTSKEIAPLLNISSRSVEVKRYRLRKKMNLAHEASLTNYIIQL